MAAARLILFYVLRTELAFIHKHIFRKLKRADNYWVPVDYTMPLNALNNSIKQILLSHFYGWGNRSSERLINLPMITKPDLNPDSFDSEAHVFGH